MTLKKEDFTDEIWADIQADIDRERLKASDTARKNAKKDAELDIEAKIHEAVEAERAKLEMNEQQKLEVERKQIEDSRKALAADRKSLAATKKLIASGFPEESIEAVLPLFVSLDDKAFDSAVDSFISVNQALVKTQVDSVKKELLNNATPPLADGDAPVDKLTKSNEMAKAGHDAEAIDVLLGTPAVPKQ
jgi:valyl-tRNA synthetase